MEAKDFNFEFGHLGIWFDDDDKAQATHDMLTGLFGFDAVDVGFGWNIADNHFEIIKEKGAGTKGHFSILCDDVVAAMKYLESKSVAFREDTFHYTDDGILWKAFAKDEVGGFAWHLTLRGRANNGKA